MDDDSAHLVRIDTSWKTYFNKKVSRKFRYDIERQLRRLNESGRLIFCECEDDKSTQNALTALFGMKIRDRKSKGEIESYFEDENFQNFDREIGSRFLRKDWLFTHILKLNDQIIAVNFDFKFNRNVYCHEIAYDNNFDRRFSPGKLLQYFEIRKSFHSKKREFDFAWGKVFYKDNWCNKERRTFAIYIFKKNIWLHRFYLKSLRPSLRYFYSTYLTPRMKYRLKNRLSIGA